MLVEYCRELFSFLLSQYVPDPREHLFQLKDLDELAVFIAKNVELLHHLFPLDHIVQLEQPVEQGAFVLLSLTVEIKFVEEVLQVLVCQLLA